MQPYYKFGSDVRRILPFLQRQTTEDRLSTFQAALVDGGEKVV